MYIVLVRVVMCVSSGQIKVVKMVAWATNGLSHGEEGRL